MRDISIAFISISMVTGAPMACAANRNVIASIIPFPSLFTWEPRGMVKPDMDLGTFMLSAHSIPTGTHARLELVPRAVIIKGDAFLRNQNGLHFPKTVSKTPYTAI